MAVKLCAAHTTPKKHGCVVHAGTGEGVKICRCTYVACVPNHIMYVCLLANVSYVGSISEG